MAKVCNYKNPVRMLMHAQEREAEKDKLMEISVF